MAAPLPEENEYLAAKAAALAADNDAKSAAVNLTAKTTAYAAVKADPKANAAAVNAAALDVAEASQNSSLATETVVKAQSKATDAFAKWTAAKPPPPPPGGAGAKAAGAGPGGAGAGAGGGAGGVGGVVGPPPAPAGGGGGGLAAVHLARASDALL